MDFAGSILEFLLTLTIVVSARSELITFGIIGSISSLLAGGGYYGYEWYKCKYMECCTDEYVLSDLDSKYELCKRRENFLLFFIYRLIF